MYVRRPVPKRPSIRPEREMADQYGGVWVAGVDEAGRGPLAGPVVAAAVILPFEGRRPVGLRDSKELKAKERDRLFRLIQNHAVSYGVGLATAQEIDFHNILEATRLAARRAIAQLDPQPGALVTDALEFPGDPRPALPLVKGDRISASISAASILAKVTRDRLMDLYAEEFPEYNWQSNRGYPTIDHYEAIATHGPTSLHRLTFQGVSFFSVEVKRSRTYHLLRDRISHLTPGNGARHAIDVLRRELIAFTERLPPPDLQALTTLLNEFDQGPSLP